jgi:Uma2 family endonuclease
MAMPVVVPRYTLEDLDSFPDDGSRYELLDGVLLVTPAPAVAHELVVARIFRILAGYLPSELAEVFTHGSIEVEPNLHLEPDLLVVPAQQIAAGIESHPRWTGIDRWWLAVEVSGEGSSLYDRDHKRPAYLALGVREVWRVDLKERCVFVSRLGGPEQQVDDQLTWRPPERAEPMLLSVKNLFRSV